MKSAAQRLAAMMRTGSCPNDQSFDRFLPEPLRLVSPEYWTPLAVVKRAADWLEAVGIRTVVDIGSGAGKFCAAGALFGRCRFIGLEQYSSLVRSAVALVDLFDLSDRVSFVAGDLRAVTAPVGDAYRRITDKACGRRLGSNRSRFAGGQVDQSETCSRRRH